MSLVTPNSLQASATRDAIGHVDRENQNAVVPYVSDGTKSWMRYAWDTPIPVTRSGESLYDEDGHPFTDWSKNATHSGRLKNLQPGNEVIFTDVEGNEFHFTVAELKVLAGTAVDEMESGTWDLTLFTCTLGGQMRVTGRCNQGLLQNRY